MAEQDEDAGRLNEAEEVLSLAFIPESDSAERLKPSSCPLHFPPSWMLSHWTFILDVTFPVLAVGAAIEAAAVIRFISDRPRRKIETKTRIAVPGQPETHSGRCLPESEHNRWISVRIHQGSLFHWTPARSNQRIPSKSGWSSRLERLCLEVFSGESSEGASSVRCSSGNCISQVVQVITAPTVTILWMTSGVKAKA